MPEGENIGSINVSVGADYSSLQAGIQAAESIAQAGGAAIGAAFTSAAQSTNVLEAAVSSLISGATSWEDALNTVSADTTVLGGAAMAAAEQLDLFGSAVSGIPWADATGQLNLFTDELEPFDAALNATAAAAEGAAKGATDLGSAAETAAPQVADADTSTKDLIQSLVGLGAALAIVRQIQDLGTAALDASDQITRAQISLTVLTGSATAASDEIAKLEALGQQDGLSMPELLTAATRMQALLGAAAPVPALLAQLANSAAVSGQGIETAAQAFDRMASSGTAAARSLLPLGVNLQDLAGAFNQLSGSATATETNVAALFKQLSETERVEVLSAALDKLNGIADQVKNETFGGQWNALVAQWSQVLAEAGQALLPVIDDLIKITETTIVPFLKGAIDLFNAMPGPVKDVTVGLGLAATGAIATAAALGTLAIAINGVKGALANLGISGALSGLGTVATETAEVGAAVATAGEAAEVAGPAFAVLGASLSEFLIPIAAVVAALGGLAYWLETTGEKSDQVSSKISFAGNQIDLASDGIKKISDATQVSVADLNTAIETYDRLNAAYEKHNASATEVAQALAAVQSAFAKLPGIMEPVGLALAVNAQAAHDAGLAYQTAKGVFDTLTAAYQAGLPVQAQWNAALAAMEAAEKKAADAGAPIAGSLAAIEVAVKNATNSIQNLATSQQLQHDKTVAQADTITTLSADVIEASTRLDLLRQRQDDLAASAANGAALQSQVDAAMGDVEAAATSLADKTQKLQQAQLNQGNAAAMAGGQVGIMSQELAQANLNLQQQIEKMDTAQGSATAYASAQQAVVDAQIKLSAAVIDANDNASRSTEVWAAVQISLDEAKAKLAILTAAYQVHIGTLAAVRAQQKAVLTAQIAEDQENAVAAAGLADVTSKEGLLKAALIDAKVAFDDLKAAKEAGQPVDAQLLAAYGSLESAQKAYTDAVTAAKSPLDSMFGSLDQLTKGQKANKDATDPATASMWAQVEASTSATPFLKAMWEQVNALSAAEHSAQGTIDTTTASIKAQAAAAGSLASEFKAASEAILGEQAASQSFSVSGGSGYTAEYSYQINPSTGTFQQTITYVATPATQFALDEKAAQAAADASSNPKNKTDDVSLAQQALAEAQALLPIIEQYFQAGTVGLKASDVQSAEQAVTTAQQALATALGNVASATSSSTSSSASATSNLSSLDAQLNQANSYLSQLTYDFNNNLTYQGSQVTQDQLTVAQAAADAAQLAVDNAVGGTSSTSSSTASSAIASSTSSSTAVDGGVYPDITAHQASGEIWNVQVASGGTSASASSSAGTADATSTSTTALAASSTASAVSSAADTLSSAVSTFAYTTTELSSIAQVVEALATQSKSVTGTVQTLSGGTTQSSTATGGGGTATIGAASTSQSQAAIQDAMNAAYAAGVTWDGSVPWDGKVPTIPSASSSVASVPSGGSGGGSGVTLNLDMSGSNFSGSDSASIAATMQSIMPDMLTRVLRNNGARY